MKSYQELIVWQRAIDLSILIYKKTNLFPPFERYGLTSQIQRNVISIPSNIAEGYARGHKKEYIQFLRIAYGSGAELETQLLIAHKLGYLKTEDYIACNTTLVEILKMLNILLKRLDPKP